MLLLVFGSELDPISLVFSLMVILDIFLKVKSGYAYEIISCAVP